MLSGFSLKLDQGTPYFDRTARGAVGCTAGARPTPESPGFIKSGRIRQHSQLHTKVLPGYPLAYLDPPTLKWSDLRYVFDIKEDRNGKEAIQARRDRREAAASRYSGLAGPRHDGG